MEFELTEEQKDIKNAAREFAEKEYDENRFRELDEKEEFPFDIWKKACELGFVGMHWPEEYGGQGLGYLEGVLVMEEFARVDLGLTFTLTTIFGADIIYLFGNEEQKQKYLPPLCKGELICGGAFTEPDAGTDLLAAKATAVLDGDEWVINGNKMFITNGTIANFFVTLCLTDPDAQKRSRRHSTIIVETDRPGVERSKIHGKMGIRLSDTAEITFKDVRVPKENLVGERGAGARQTLTFFDIGRLWVAAQAVGAAQGVLERTIEHVKTRQTFGTPVAMNQDIQFRLAKHATWIEACRNMLYKAAWKIDKGDFDPTLSAMAKWYAARMAVEVIDDCLQMHGGYGYINEYPIERAYRDVKVLEIYEGVREAELMTIARSLLT